jgi:hypothetical protein
VRADIEDDELRLMSAVHELLARLGLYPVVRNAY